MANKSDNADSVGQPTKNLNNPAPETAEQAVARLDAENKALKGQLSLIASAQQELSAQETLIAEKMGFGLTREQALNVIKLQAAHDKIRAARQAEQPA
jgi:hypothetical protein